MISIYRYYELPQQPIRVCGSLDDCLPTMSEVIVVSPVLQMVGDPGITGNKDHKLVQESISTPERPETPDIVPNKAESISEELSVSDEHEVKEPAITENDGSVTKVQDLIKMFDR